MVNPAIFAAGATANAARRTAQQSVIAQFTAAKAFEPSGAIAIAPDGFERDALTELVALAIVRPLGDGRYYLDRERQRERAAQGGWIALVILLGAGSAVASFIALAAL